MKKEKFYVVWAGVTPGIYTSWTECQLQTKGYEGAKFKSFDTREEAEHAFAASPYDYIKRNTSAGSTQGYVATITAKQLPEALTKKIYSISSSIGSLERGMQYVFDVTVNTNGYVIESSSSPIAGWEEGDKISGEGEETQP